MNRAKGVTAESVWREYEKMLAYNESIQLDDTVRVNENFFVGKQWEGVESNGLPTPVFNFLKRVTLFTVASITSDRIKLLASPVDSSSGDGRVVRAVDVVNAEFDALFEHNRLPTLIHEYLRNAAVDGDAATYTYWDGEAPASGGGSGAVVTEIVPNTRVGFGNCADRRVQSQPYILIKRRELTERLKKRAKTLGCREWEDIRPDTDEQQADAYKDTGDKTTVILRLWKDEDTRTVWAAECARGIMVREPWDLGLTLYPVTWLCWDYVQDSYHGQAMLTGLIPNQIYINKLFAMTMISLTQEMTQSNLGATSVALGEARPDNTSAIVALQRAAATPNELTRQNLYQSIEELGRIYLDFMAGYYGVRMVEVDPAEEVPEEVLEFAAGALPLNAGGKLVVPYDFAGLREIPMRLKLDVGASAYWSEIASAQTLDNLLAGGQITLGEYLERIPDEYVTDREGLIKAVKARS